jgi:hypothetical protein
MLLSAHGIAKQWTHATGSWGAEQANVQIDQRNLRQLEAHFVARLQKLFEAGCTLFAACRQRRGSTHDADRIRGSASMKGATFRRQQKRQRLFAAAFSELLVLEKGLSAPDRGLGQDYADVRLESGLRAASCLSW